MNSCFARRVGAFAATVLLIPAPLFAADSEMVGERSGISGRVADITDYTHSSGYRFLVALRGLSYAGQTDRTVLERHEDGKLTIWMGFRDIHLTIGRISLSGEPGSATCGPLALHIGHQREIWVAFDFEHRAGAARLLTLSGSRCQIENDNWAIGSPAWVQTTGLFMSQSKVVSGVRSGLAGKRARIEQELQRIAYAVLGKSCSDSGEAPANRDDFEEAVAARLVQDGYLSTSQPTGQVPFPLTGFTEDQPVFIHTD